MLSEAFEFASDCEIYRCQFVPKWNEFMRKSGAIVLTMPKFESALQGMLWKLAVDFEGDLSSLEILPNDPFIVTKNSKLIRTEDLNLMIAMKKVCQFSVENRENIRLLEKNFQMMNSDIESITKDPEKLLQENNITLIDTMSYTKKIQANKRRLAKAYLVIGAIKIALEDVDRGLQRYAIYTHNPADMRRYELIGREALQRKIYLPTRIVYKFSKEMKLTTYEDHFDVIDDDIKAEKICVHILESFGVKKMTSKGPTKSFVRDTTQEVIKEEKERDKDRLYTRTTSFTRPIRGDRQERRDTYEREEEPLRGSTAENKENIENFNQPTIITYERPFAKSEIVGKESRYREPEISPRSQMTHSIHQHRYEHPDHVINQRDLISDESLRQSVKGKTYKKSQTTSGRNIRDSHVDIVDEEVRRVPIVTQISRSFVEPEKGPEKKDQDFERKIIREKETIEMGQPTKKERNGYEDQEKVKKQVITERREVKPERKHETTHLPTEEVRREVVPMKVIREVTEPVQYQTTYYPREESRRSQVEVKREQPREETTRHEIVEMPRQEYRRQPYDYQRQGSEMKEEKRERQQPQEEIITREVTREIREPAKQQEKKPETKITPVEVFREVREQPREQQRQTPKEESRKPVIERQETFEKIKHSGTPREETIHTEVIKEIREPKRDIKQEEQNRKITPIEYVREERRPAEEEAEFIREVIPVEVIPEQRRYQRYNNTPKNESGTRTGYEDYSQRVKYDNSTSQKSKRNGEYNRQQREEKKTDTHPVKHSPLKSWNLSLKKAYAAIDRQPIIVLEPAKDLDYVIAGNKQGFIILWKFSDINSINEEKAMKLHDGPVKSLLYLNDGKYLISGGLDGRIVKCDLTLFTSSLVDDTQGPVRALANPFTGNTILAACENKIVSVDIFNNKVIWIIEAHKDFITDLAYDHKTDLIFSSSRDRTIKIFRHGTGEFYGNLEGHNDVIKSMCVAEIRDQTYVISISKDLFITFWNLNNKNMTKVITMSHSAKKIFYLWDKQSVMTVGKDGVINLWNIDTGEVKELYFENKEYLAGCYYDNGEDIITSTTDGVLEFWKAD